jgi:glutamate synthase (NADPH/NADH) large chain
VDISVKRWGLSHDMPLFIPAMSFGSQGENSFRAYAEAARRLNIVCINGEGGEIPDMLGRYFENRGQQIASGRFGVFMHFLNSTRFLEIKIGQGAKPGEGGHLPGAKVSEMVAQARHCKPGIPLISPSNQHDIYSIEDLYQIISELKTANPEARVSVKIPVTANVGTIAVGIAKAGADIIDLSGFEGGTGAAREHAKKYVGLPVEIGVCEAHRMLAQSGLRNGVEIWADGGLRSGRDALKMVLLGADRVGLGTVALMGLGCISCRRCHMDKCPRGISTQLRTKADAEARGVKGFSPVQLEAETENLVRLLGYVGEEMRMLVAGLGETRLQDLVGRTDLLEQTRLGDRVDTSGILAGLCALNECEEEQRPRIMARRPLNYLTRLISDMAMERFQQGKETVFFRDEEVRSFDRAVGTYLSGTMVREYGDDPVRKVHMRLGSSVPGNGLAAFNIENVDIVVDGGGQDGVAKGAFGGLVCVLKGANLWGTRVDGSAGKSCAYGAIRGTLIVQNYCDSRACIRMSGADAVFGGRITDRLRDEEGNIAVRSHLKGFAFEYMTGGRAVVLGDPGPWICAGMTGGVVYQCLYPEFGFTRESLGRRLATGADVSIRRIDKKGLADVHELLGLYVRELVNSFQYQEAEVVEDLLDEAEERFVMIVPRPQQPPSES